MGAQQDFSTASVQPLRTEVTFSNDPVLSGFTFFLADQDIGPMLEEAYQSGALARSVQALKACKLQDGNLGVVRGKTFPICGAPPLLVYGMNKDGHCLEVRLGSDHVTFCDQIPEHNPVGRCSNPFMDLFVMGLRPFTL